MSEPRLTNEELRQIRSSAAMGGLLSSDALRILDELEAARQEMREREGRP